MPQNKNSSRRRRAQAGDTDQTTTRKKRISRNIYKPGYDTSREYERGYNTNYNDDRIYEPKFADDNETVDSGTRPGKNKRSNNRGRQWEEDHHFRGSEENDLKFMENIGHNIKQRWDNWANNSNQMDYPDKNERLEGYERNKGESTTRRPLRENNRQGNERLSQYFRGRDWDIEGEFEERDEQFPARSSQESKRKYSDIYETDFKDDNDYERAFRNRNRSRVLNNVDNDGDYGYGHRDGFDSVYNAINENSYQGYERGQEEFSGDERRMGMKWRSRKDSGKYPSKYRKRK
jgi:hypothetical protein